MGEQTLAGTPEGTTHPSRLATGENQRVNTLTNVRNSVDRNQAATATNNNSNGQQTEDNTSLSQQEIRSPVR